MGKNAQSLVVVILVFGILQTTFAKKAPKNRLPSDSEFSSVDPSLCRFGKGWTNFMGGCYLISEKSFAWKDAAVACRRIDAQADFGTLWTLDDMRFVASLARKKKIKRLFVNGKFDSRSLEFRWQYNRPVDGKYTPWGKNEPKAAVQVISLVSPPDKSSRPHLSAVPMSSSTQPILCKRPARGFRRRSAKGLGQKGSSGWSLINGKGKITPVASSKTPSRKSVQTKPYGGRTQKSPARKASGNSPGPGSTQASPSGSRKSSSASKTGSNKARSEPYASSGKARQSQIQATTKPTTRRPTTRMHPTHPPLTVPPSTTRTMPPPISKDRKFLVKEGHFKPVLPVAKVSHDLEVSAIEPVDVVDLVKVKEEKLNELYGRSRLRLKDDMEFFPEDYRYPATDYERMAHILTTELIAEDKRSQKSDAPFEVAKLLTTELFAKGKAIQCYFGEKEDVLNNRQVECIATAGVIESCVKQTLLTGKIIRGCGLPGTAPESYDTHKSGGHHKTGCVKSHNGEFCYCDKDFCNTAHRVERLWTVLLLLGSFLLHFYDSFFSHFSFVASWA